MNSNAGNANLTIPYPSLLAEQEDLETLIRDSPPSLIAIPSWPPTKALPTDTVPSIPSCVIEDFPCHGTVSMAPPTFVRMAPHNLSPFGSARKTSLLNSASAMRAAYAFLGASAVFASWSLAHFL